MRSRLALVLVPAVLSAVLAMVACDDETGISGAVLDAGKLDVEVTPPIAEVDASALEDVAVAPAAVTVVVSGTQVAGAEVVFHDATGAVIARGQTDATGKVASDVAGIAMVTVVQTRDTRVLGTTFTSVAAGDVLRLRELPLPGTVGTVAVGVPALAGARAPATVTAGGCSTTIPLGTTGDLPLTAACVGSTPTSLLAMDVLATSGETRYAFTRQGPAAPTDGGTASATIPTPWVAPSTTVVTIASFPPAATLSTSVAAIASDLLFPFATQATTGAPASHAYATSFGDALQATASFTSGVASTTVARRYDLGGAVTIDWAAALPLLTAKTIDATVPNRPKFSWDGAAAAADGERVLLLFSPGDGKTHFWTFVTPPGTGEVQAPVVPAELGLAPAADAGTVTYRAFVDEIEADAFADAAAFRQQQGALLGPWITSPNVLPPLPANGQYRHSVTSTSAR